MDPFSAMSQDDYKKIEEVLQSEQGRAILNETTSQVRAPGVSGLINTSMDGLGLSDTDLVDNLALDPGAASNFFAVTNDEDVATLASDILQSNAVKVLEANSILMDHSYSQPAENEAFNLMKDGKQNCETPLAADGDNESTDSANSPISAHESVSGSAKTEDEAFVESSCPSRDVPYDKVLEESEIKENSLLSASDLDSRLEKLTGVNLSVSGLQGRVEVGKKALKEVVPVPTFPQTRGRTRAPRHLKSVSSVDESDDLFKTDKEPTTEKDLEECTNGSIVGDTTDSFSPVPRGRRARNTQKHSMPTDGEAVHAAGRGKVNSSQRELPISGQLLSKHGFGIISKGECKRFAKNSDKPVSKFEQEDRGASPLKSSSEKRVRKSSIKSDELELKDIVSPTTGRRKSMEQSKKEVLDGSLSKKKSSVSESKAELKSATSPNAKRRRMSSGSDTFGSSTSSAILKTKIVRPKKKVARSDSISADMLGPALFSEPDVMVKVKADDSVDDKSEKIKISPLDNDGMQNSAESKEASSKSPNELDMIKAEVSQKDDEYDATVTQQEAVLDRVKPDNDKMSKRESVEKMVVEASEERAGQSVAVNDENEKVVKTSESRSAVSKVLLGGVGNEDASTSQRPLRERQIFAAVMDVSHEKEEDVANKPVATTVRTRRSNVKSNQQSAASPAGEDSTENIQNMTGKSAESSEGGQHVSSSVVDKTKMVESVRPERKSQRVHKKRKLYDDEESPERLRKERKQTPAKNAENPKKVPRTNKKVTEGKAKRQEPEEEDEPAEEEYADDPEDSDWDSEDDPEKLWCICRQPHNNKFMIQCDKCQDWFHGTCVSVTRQLGRQLEKEKKEWICPVCTKGSNAKNARESQSSMPKETKVIEKTARRQVRAIPKKEAPVAVPHQQDARSRPHPSVLPSARRNEAANKVTAADVKRPQNNSTKESKATKQSFTTAEEKNTKSETVSKESRTSERVTRNTIPKDYILKSRDPIKRESVSVEKETPKISNTSSKVEAASAKNQDLSAKVPPARTGKAVVKTETLKQESFVLDSMKPKAGRASTTKETQKPQVQKEISKPNTPKEVLKTSSIPKDLPKPSVQKISRTKSCEDEHVSESKTVKEKSSVSTRRSSQSSAIDKRTEKALSGPDSKISNKDSVKSSVPKTLKSETHKKKNDTSLKERKQMPNKRKYDCIVCSKPAPLGTLYCTSTCLEKYAAESIKIITSALKPNEDLDSKKVVVLDRQTGNLATGVNAPVVSELVSWLKANPSCEVVRPNAVPASPKKEQQQTPKERDLFERDERDESAIRVNVRRTMRAILMDRCRNSEDLKVPEEEIMKIAIKIEEELHKCFKDNSSKYRNKYRSLMFNIKDPRNQGLFRKILKGKIPPDKLVRMSPEELASKELAKWREQENQHNLDMIKRMQIEQQQSSGLRKKTHKGEIEIEDDVPVVGFEELAVDAAKTPPRPVEETIEVTPEKKEEKKEEKETEKDTTSSHRSHLFDLNCKICTGKMAPPPPEEPVPKKVRVAHSISVEPTSKANDVEKSFPSAIDNPALISDASNDSMDKDLLSQRCSDAGFSSQKQDSTKQPTSVWKGFVYMQDVTKFVTCAYRVSGPTDFLNQDIPDTVQVCGRIAPEHVYDYLSKIKQSGNKELTIIRFKAANDEESGTYNEFYQYLSTRKRYGVVSSSSKHVKDFYIVPLAAQAPVPNVLLPFSGPGLPSKRPHLLLGVLVRHRSRQASAQSKQSTSKEDDVLSTSPTSNTAEEGSYTPPIESGPYTPHNEDEAYTPPLEDQSYTPPLEDRSYTPPLEDRSFTPTSDHSAALPGDNYSSGGSPPFEGGSYTPPFDERNSYTPPLGDVSYTPPLEDGSYTPPLPYRSSNKKKTSAYVPLAISSSSLKRVREDDAYEPSYTPPLDQFPRSCDDEDMQPYDPEQMDQLSDESNHAKRMKLMMFPNSAVSSSSQSESSPADIERQKRILNELTQKVQETDRQVYQSMNVLKQLGADVPDIDSQHITPDKEVGSASSSLSGMSSFLNNLPQNLREIFSSVSQSSSAVGRVSIDSRISSDFPGAVGEFDVDERSSSQGGTPPPCDDEGHGSSELRPSDPRIKIRTSFHDDQYAAELAQKSLSSMSMSELVKRAEKELADIESPVKAPDGSVGDEYSTQSWQSHHEPPPPGIEPPDMLSTDNSAFASMSDSSSASQSSAIYPSTPVPEGHVLAPPFVQPSPSAVAAPAIAPPVFPTHLPPPGYPLHSPSVNAQAPALPPAFMAPPPPVPPVGVPPPLPPDVIDQREKGYLSWPEGTAQEFGSQQRNWEKQDWGDWDHRSPYERDRMPPASQDFFSASERQDDWYRDQRRRDFYPEEHSRESNTRWPKEDWERHRFDRNRQHFGGRFRRGNNRRDDNWRGNNGRRRVFSHPQRD